MNDNEMNDQVNNIEDIETNQTENSQNQEIVDDTISIKENPTENTLNIFPNDLKESIITIEESTRSLTNSMVDMTSILKDNLQNISNTSKQHLDLFELASSEIHKTASQLSTDSQQLITSMQEIAAKKDDLLLIVAQMQDIQNDLSILEDIVERL
eukprot:TRINITY_DN12846_c0_g1_i1.p1 TRINITY_DN12846_c0_g1~~TRINITY_DN12846_c0_g1_i1.p1  ORF type:complete len:166 (+),score=52.72 TRINITY_DN12846_c0_g1_i1:35-499(+)